MALGARKQKILSRISLLDIVNGEKKTPVGEAFSFGRGRIHRQLSKAGDRMKNATLLVLATACLFTAAAEEVPSQQPSGAATQTSAPTRLDDPDKLSVAIYPIFGWLPSFSSSVDLPPLTDGGGSSSGTTDRNFDGAVAFAGSVTVKKWLVEGEVTFVKASSTRTTPYLEVNTTLDYGDLFVGRYVGKGFYALGGFRRMALEFDVKVASLPPFSQKPGVWDPLVGVEWRRALGRKVMAQARFDGGGFGVGSDVDLDAQARLEWRFIKHVGAVVGYQWLHTRTSGTISRSGTIAPGDYPWTYRQTFMGPIVGVGIYF
jgi:hypothetical protein